MGPRPRASNEPKSPVKLARGITQNTKYRLIACSGGRCQFQGCNKDLFQHPVTGQEGNYSEAAHIVGFKVLGPRGENTRPKDIHHFENLMLLCKDCHHLIDTQPLDFPVELLKTFKQAHEERIFALTALGPEYRTTIIQLRGTIGGQPVDIPPADIKAALMPRYPARLPGVLMGSVHETENIVR